MLGFPYLGHSEIKQKSAGGVGGIIRRWPASWAIARAKASASSPVTSFDPSLGIAERVDRSILLGLRRLADRNRPSVARTLLRRHGGGLTRHAAPRLPSPPGSVPRVVSAEVGKNAVNDLYDFPLRCRHGGAAE